MAASKASTTAAGKGGLSARLRLARARLGDFAYKNLLNVGAVSGACLLLGADHPVWHGVGVLAVLASLVAIVWRRRQAFLHPGTSQPRRGNLLGYFVSLRAISFFALGAAYALRRPDEGGWIWAAVAVAVLVVLSEPLTKTLLDTNKQTVVNLPGVRPVPPAPISPSWPVIASVALLVLGGVLAAVAAPGWILLVLALALVPPAAMLVLHAVRATSASARAEKQIPQALRKLEPAFVVYYAATQGARYQLGMWLPYLERLGRPYVVITRNAETVPVIRTLTSAPILVPKTDNVSNSLDSMVVPSMKAAFYVQGSPANQTMQRYRQLTHVWLNHGDSDKQANFHPRHATYDRLFVSGQQGVERYAKHGIDVPPDRFVIVGRPQIETIESRDTPLPVGAPRTVLYAPTWKGGRPSTNYSSLPLGAELVKALLERGATVIFRPHPVSYEDREDARRIRHLHLLLEADRTASGRQHVWGARAEQEWDVPACFNASDAVITDVSSIANDYLASGKPFAMCAITVGGAEFVQEFPTAQVAYVIERDLSTLPQVLDALFGEDTLSAARLAYRRFCLGPWVGAHAADEFLRVAGALVSGRAA
ncbi:MAG TPA: CDP-glycerol glycerophosphotransferase family protein [Propionibacteriaceae bacterium]|nr:CDP-glycerol glycerophosphotransferase family protein [Propionibacteriaceae bacterium]